MTPAPFHAKEEQYDGGPYDQPPFKIHPLPPSSAASSNKPQEQPPPPPPPRPVIIYTHSPKVIHTQPRDFMALVQKLTGYTRPPEDPLPAQDPRHGQHGQGNNVEDNESTSVVTEEHGSSVSDISQVNSCLVEGGVGAGPPPYRTAGFDPYFNPTPVFPTNRTDYLCAQPFYSPESLVLNRNSLSASSSSSLRVLKDYPDI